MDYRDAAKLVVRMLGYVAVEGLAESPEDACMFSRVETTGVDQDEDLGHFLLGGCQKERGGRVTLVSE